MRTDLETLLAVLDSLAPLIAKAHDDLVGEEGPAANRIMGRLEAYEEVFKIVQKTAYESRRLVELSQGGSTI